MAVRWVDFLTHPPNLKSLYRGFHQGQLHTQEALPGFSHIPTTDNLNTTPLSQGCMYPGEACGIGESKRKDIPKPGVGWGMWGEELGSLQLPESSLWVQSVVTYSWWTSPTGYYFISLLWEMPSVKLNNYILQTFPWYFKWTD